jgi:hypothetical protein
MSAVVKLPIFWELLVLCLPITVLTVYRQQMVNFPGEEAYYSDSK